MRLSLAHRQAKAPMDAQPLASRTPDRPTVELRQDIDRGVCDVLDAVAKARRMTRSEVVADILAKWAKSSRRHPRFRRSAFSLRIVFRFVWSLAIDMPAFWYEIR